MTKRQKMPISRTQSYVVQLECNCFWHCKIAPPEVGDVVWCFRHESYMTVTIANAEIRVSCETCVYSRPYGRALLNAEIAAANHRKSRPSHTVSILDGPKVIRVLKPQTSMLALVTGDEDIPPF